MPEVYKDTTEQIRNFAIGTGTLLVSTVASHIPIGFANLFGLEHKLDPDATKNISLLDIKLEPSLDQLANLTQLAGLTTLFLSESKTANENNRDIDALNLLLSSMATLLAPHYFTKVIDNLSEAGTALFNQEYGQAIRPVIELATVGYAGFTQYKAINNLTRRDQPQPESGPDSPPTHSISRRDKKSTGETTLDPNPLRVDHASIDLLTKYIEPGNATAYGLAADLESLIKDNNQKPLTPRQTAKLQREIERKYHELGKAVGFPKLHSTALQEVVPLPDEPKRKRPPTFIARVSKEIAEKIMNGKYHNFKD